MTTTISKPKRNLSRAVLAGTTLVGFSLMSAMPALAAVTPVHDSVSNVDGKGYGVEYLPSHYNNPESLINYLGSLTVADSEGVIDGLYAWCNEWDKSHIEGLEPTEERTLDGQAATQANYIIQKYQDDVNMHPEISASVHDLLDDTASVTEDNDNPDGGFYWGNLRDWDANGFKGTNGSGSVDTKGESPYQPVGEAQPLSAVLSNADALVAEAETYAGNYAIDLEFGEVDSLENTVDVTVNVVDGAGNTLDADHFSDGEDSGILLNVAATGVEIDTEDTANAAITPGETVTLKNVGSEDNMELRVESNSVFPGSTVEQHHYDDAQDKVFIGSNESISTSESVPTTEEPTAPDAPEVDINVGTQASENVIKKGESFYDNIAVSGFDELSEYLEETQTVESQLWYTGDVDPSEEAISYEEFQEALEAGEIEAELVEELTTDIDGNVITDEYVQAEGEDILDSEGNPFEFGEDAVLDGIYATDEFTPDAEGYYVYTESVTVDGVAVLDDDATNTDFDVPIQLQSQSDFGVAAETILVEPVEDTNSQKQQQQQQQNQETIIEIVNNPQIDIHFDKDGNLVDGDGNPVDEDDVIDDHEDDVDPGDDSDNGDDTNGGDDNANGDDIETVMDGGGGAGNGDDTDAPAQSAPKANPDAADNTKVISGNTSGGEMATWGAGLLGLAGAAGLAARTFFRRGAAADEA